MDAVAVAIGLSGAVTTLGASYGSWRAGAKAERDKHDDEIDDRVRELELGMREVQTLIRERRQERRRSSG